MNNKDINNVCKTIFQATPTAIIRQTVGICNEVYEVKFSDNSYILRMNREKRYLYGTHQFLPLFKKLDIKTPNIITEDYSKEQFPFCYQFLSKLEGKDLGIVIGSISAADLKTIALEISNIFDKFKAMPPANGFGLVTGLDEENYDNLLEMVKNQRKATLARNEKTKVLDSETIDILNNSLSSYQDYFLQVSPKLYYDDICSKNVMIHNGKFSGLVDLDFLIKGDYLEAIGRIMASWYGDKHGEIYINAILKFQKLTKNQLKIVKLYALLNLISWTSEEGIQFNQNSSNVINWEKVKKRKQQILELYDEIKIK